MIQNITDLAATLGVSRPTAYRILETHGIPHRSFNAPEYAKLIKAICVKYGPFENAYTTVASLENFMDVASKQKLVNSRLTEKLLEAYEKLEGGK